MNARTNPIFQDDFMAPLLGMESVPDILTLGTEGELLERGHSQMVCALWSYRGPPGSYILVNRNTSTIKSVPCHMSLPMPPVPL